MFVMKRIAPRFAEIEAADSINGEQRRAASRTTTFFMRRTLLPAMNLRNRVTYSRYRRNALRAQHYHSARTTGMSAKCVSIL